MGWADNQLIATRDCCGVKGRNSITVRGRRTQPLLMMAINSNHPQTGKRHGHPQPARQPLMLVNNQKSGHLGFSQKSGSSIKTVHIKVLSHTTNSKKQHFATTTLKFWSAKCSVTISNVCSHPTGPRHLAPTQKDRVAETGNQHLRHLKHI